MSFLPGMSGIAGMLATAVVSSASVQHTARASDASDTNTYSFASQAIGAAPSGGQTRHVIVAVWMEEIAAGTIVLSSATIGGVSATVLGPAIGNGAGTGSNQNYMTFIIAEVPSGTTGTVALTFSGTASRAAIDVFAAYDLQSPTPIDTDGTLSNNTAIPIDRQEDGIVVAAGWAFGGTGTTWTGVTEDTDAGETIELAGRTSAASVESTVTETADVTGNFSGSLTRPIFIAGSWR